MKNAPGSHAMTATVPKTESILGYLKVRVSESWINTDKIIFLQFSLSGWLNTEKPWYSDHNPFD
jgi:hypothetical protein